MVLFLKKVKSILLIDAFIFIVCIAGIYHLIEKAGINPDDDVIFNVSKGQLVVKRIINPNFKQLFLPGDIITEIKGHTIFSRDDFEIICDSYQIGEIVEIQVKREGELFLQSIELDSFYSPAYLMIDFIIGCIFFFLGLFVLIKRPTYQPARIYHWLSVSVAIIIMTTWGRYTINPQGLGHAIRIVFSMAYAYTPVLFVFLSFIFPRKKKIPSQNLILFLFTISTLLVIWTVFSFLKSINPPSAKWLNIYILGFNCIRWYFASCIIYGIINFIHSYSTAFEEAERRKLRWVILGLVVGPLSFIFLWQIPQALGYYGLVPEEFILIILTIVPITFTTSIIRYHIMNIDLIFNRSTVYIILVSIIMIVYTAVVALATVIIGTRTAQTSLIIPAIAAIVVAILFEPARQTIQTFVDKKFFRVRYNYRIAQRIFTKGINESIELKSLAKFVRGQLEELLHLDKFAFIIIDSQKSKWTIYAQQNFIKPDKRFQSLVNEIASNSQYHILASSKYIESGALFQPIDFHEILDQQIFLISVIKSKESKIIGYLLLGNKKSGIRFSLEDVDLLNTICSQLSLAIDRIRLQYELITKNAETEKLKELNELKSYFVSSVSHELKTPLTSIKMFSEILQSKKNISGKNKKEYLEIIEGESERLSRLINNVLDFSKTERGIKQYNFKKTQLNEIINTVLLIMKYELIQNGFKTDLKLSNKEITLHVDQDALIEAVTNLISNAIKYSQENKYLSISTNISNDYAIIKVGDKGIGISEDDQKHIFDTFYRSKDQKIQNMGGAGLGLTLVKNIVEAHKGKIELESMLDKGSIFSLFLPRGVSYEEDSNH